MKRYIKQILIATTVLLANCTSNQNNPADSHPGSGTVKAGRDAKEKEKKDTAINTTTDTVRTPDKKP
jgi:hypothetical protein